MTLRQHSLLRGSKTFAIDGANLRFSFHSLARDYAFEVALTDVRPKFDDLRQVAWSWYLVGLLAVALLVFQLRAGLPFDPMSIVFVIVYAGLGIYALGVAHRRSGRFVIIRAAGDEPRTMWMFRDAPSRPEVDAFLAELRAAIQRATVPAASPGKPLGGHPAPGPSAGL